MRRIAIAVMLAFLAAPQALACDIDGFECTCQQEQVQVQVQERVTVSGEEFMALGVVEHNGVTETWYSSNALYHWRTPEWEADEEGFYRTDEGYYVVATDAWPEGAVIETSRGPAQVLDGGCGGNVDFYTNF